jgi:tRNA threonylcarbamoyladenosine biosynthesis protein TsaE
MKIIVSQDEGYVAWEGELNTLEDLRVVANLAATIVKASDKIILCGPLGAGKTTFVRYFVEALGGDPRMVTSPTFMLEHRYPTTERGMISHWDLYRLADPPQDWGPEDGVFVSCIEWGDKFLSVLSEGILVLYWKITVSLANNTLMRSLRMIHRRGIS